MKFISLTYGYNDFCYNSECNVKWYNKNTDRHAVATESTKKIYEKGDVSQVQTGYWIKKGFTEDEAKQKVHERQSTFTLEKCIEKLGEVEGTKRWQERQDKWQNTLKSKHPEEIARINKAKISKGFHEYFSIDEKELCKILNCESSFVIFKSDEMNCYIYDMRMNNKLIEYNGDYWHCNPKIYKPEFFNKNLGITAEEKWKRDAEKIQFAKDKGYEILVIWEQDYQKDKEQVIKECRNFLEIEEIKNV